MHCVLPTRISELFEEMFVAVWEITSLLCVCVCVCVLLLREHHISLDFSGLQVSRCLYLFFVRCVGKGHEKSVLRMRKIFELSEREKSLFVVNVFLQRP